MKLQTVAGKTKDQYTGEYLDRKMKGNKLPYGLEWYNLVAKLTDFAERKFDRLIKKHKS